MAFVPAQSNYRLNLDRSGYEHIEEVGTLERVIEKIREKSYGLGEKAIITVAELFEKQVEMCTNQGLDVRIGVRKDNESALSFFYTGDHYDSVISIAEEEAGEIEAESININEAEGNKMQAGGDSRAVKNKVR